MTATFRVRCHFCQTAIDSANHVILDDVFPICAACELESLLHDPEFAWSFDGAFVPPLSPEEF